MNMKVKTSGWIMGRNGLADITEIMLMRYDSNPEKVKIDGIGKRGVINGGLEIEAKAMTELALLWLKERYPELTLTKETKERTGEG